jgi:hypothetical protein
MWIEDKFLTWWPHGPRYSWSKLRRRLFEGGFLSKPLPEVHSLADILACLQKVDWKKDWIPQLFDCVSYPQRVWAKKTDDCDGFAILTAELLTHLDPATAPIIITAMVAPMKNCHSVCVFKQDGDLRYFSNKELSPRSFQSYQDIVADFTRPSDRLICWDVVKPGTLEQLEFNII